VVTAGVAAGSHEQHLSLRCRPPPSVDRSRRRRQGARRRLASRVDKVDKC